MLDRPVRRRSLGIVSLCLAALVAVLVLLGAAPSSRADIILEPERLLTPSTTAPPTTAPPPEPASPPPPPPRDVFYAADAIVGQVPIYAEPGGGQPAMVLSNPTDENVPLVFHVRGDNGADWILVQVPERPNGNAFWVHASHVAVRAVEYRVAISLPERLLRVYQGHTDHVVFEAPVAIGKPATPTPVGSFYVDIVNRPADPSGPFGAYQLSVAAFSDVYDEFGGGDGQIAIHGTNQPHLIGGAVSNGCVRMHNEDITRLVSYAPAGTPVDIYG